MGYILPITNHTSQNYQYRMIENKEGPYHIGSPFKVVFREIKKDTSTEEQHQLYKQQLFKKENESVVKVRSYQIEANQKAELTGKGGQVNVQV